MRQIDLVRRSSAGFDTVVQVAAERASAWLSTGKSGLESAGPDQLGGEIVDAALRGSEAPPTGRGETALEAIILAELRPAYLMIDDRIEIEGAFDNVSLIKQHKEKLETACKSVGSVDILNYASMAYVGTGWLIAEDVVVTNRHVAEAFAKPTWPVRWEFAPSPDDGCPLEVALNPGRQRSTGGRPRLVATEVLYMAGPREPDVALLRVQQRPGPLPALTPVSRPLERGAAIAAVGYPAADGGRNDSVLMDDIFGCIYDVKRFSPGLVGGCDEVVLLGDYTSLGGSSGSAILSLDCCNVAALHFAGKFGETNYAVMADVVFAMERGIRSQIGYTGPVMNPELADHAERRPPAHFAGRCGYDPEFLGTGDLQFGLPDLGCRRDDVAPVKGADDDVLRYTHFSVIQSASRRLPMLTAVNIDGERAFSLKRRDAWHTDGRVEPEHQIDNILYKYNPLDRGHMVRRKDPGWGETREEAEQAEEDTFVYTNCAPQHRLLNQRDWAALEDYILSSAETLAFRASVMTGPVFRDSDRSLTYQPGAEDVAIPEAFWKLAVMVNAETGKLSATAYILTQGELIRDLTEAAFVLGEFRTYQVKVTFLEEITGFDFGALRYRDPMGSDLESRFSATVRMVDGAEGLKLS